MRIYKLKSESSKTAQSVIAEKQKVWIGIDSHKINLHITVIDQEDIVWKGTVPNSFEHVRGLINRCKDCEIEAVYETGPTGYSLKHWLEELGCRAMITPVSKVPEQKGGKRIKTDERDSLQLATLLRAGMLTGIHDLGKENYCERELTRTRQQLREDRTAICNKIKSKLLYHGVEKPADIKANWSKGYLAWLENSPSGNQYLDMAIRSLVKMYHDFTKQMKILKKEVDQLATKEKYEKDVELLTSAPGVGTLSAMTILVELGEISRFERSEEFSSFLGLIPGEWSSGENQRKGGCIRWGNSRARTVLVESSWMLIGKDPQMRATYDRIKNRRGAGRAIVAVARRLGLILRAMLRDRTPYDYPGPATG